MSTSATPPTKPVVEVKDGKAVIPKDYKPYPGKKSGRCYELSAIFHIRPGHLEALKAAATGHSSTRGAAAKSAADIETVGIHQTHHLIFDNGTRFAIQNIFDTEWDPYVDDSVRLLGGKSWYNMFKHLEEFPEDLDEDNTAFADVFKVAFNACRAEAVIFTRSYPNSVGEIMRALKLQEAFQKVLDNPDAAKALEHPALKPLLDLAAQ